MTRSTRVTKRQLAARRWNALTRLLRGHAAAVESPESAAYT